MIQVVCEPNPDDGEAGLTVRNSLLIALVIVLAAAAAAGELGNRAPVKTPGTYPINVPNPILQGGDTVDNATDIWWFPYEISGTTVGYHDDYSSTCYLANGAPDVVYRVVIPAGVNRLPDVHAADINVILDAYRRLGRQAEQIVSIHMSSELSPMWQQARRAAEMLKGRYSIRVIDSLSTSYGLGLLVEQAAIAAAKGASLSEIRAFAETGSHPELAAAALRRVVGTVTSTAAKSSPS